MSKKKQRLWYVRAGDTAFPINDKIIGYIEFDKDMMRAGAYSFWCYLAHNGHDSIESQEQAKQGLIEMHNEAVVSTFKQIQSLVGLLGGSKDA